MATETLLPDEITEADQWTGAYTDINEGVDTNDGATTTVDCAEDPDNSLKIGFSDPTIGGTFTNLKVRMAASSQSEEQFAAIQVAWWLGAVGQGAIDTLSFGSGWETQEAEIGIDESDLSALVIQLIYLPDEMDPKSGCAVTAIEVEVSNESATDPVEASAAARSQMQAHVVEPGELIAY